MNLTTKNLRKLGKDSSELKSDVIDIILNNSDADGLKGWFEDLMKYGCVSGMVGGLVYYSDTVAFFERNKDAIFELALDQTKNFGNKNILEMLGGLNGANNVGDYDQFANLMSWYAFEETARDIYENDFGINE